MKRKISSWLNGNNKTIASGLKLISDYCNESDFKKAVVKQDITLITALLKNRIA